MKKSLPERIYKAQCFGNVEPIEYMTPYPSLAALVEGQNIKHHGKMLYADLDITNLDFYKYVQQIANWLTEKGLKSKQRVQVFPQEYPLTEMLVFGIWTVGASVILSENNEDTIYDFLQPDMIIDNHISMDYFMDQKNTYDPVYKPFLGDEAMVFVKDGKGIRLSHYNLLVNANDVQRKLNLYDDGKFYVQLEPNSTAWVVLQAIFPLYTGAPLTKNNPDLTIGLNDADYIVDFNWKEIKNSNHIYILPENTAVLSIGNRSLQMTNYLLDNHKLSLNGHSVMMGYTDDKINEEVFMGESLILHLNQ
ncbi:MAG: hypothetical protein ACE5D0_09580 [Fidelibacterota bacterium]